MLQCHLALTLHSCTVSGGLRVDRQFLRSRSEKLINNKGQKRWLKLADLNLCVKWTLTSAAVKCEREQQWWTVQLQAVINWALNALITAHYRTFSDSIHFHWLRSKANLIIFADRLLITSTTHWSPAPCLWRHSHYWPAPLRFIWPDFKHVNWDLQHEMISSSLWFDVFIGAAHDTQTPVLTPDRVVTQTDTNTNFFLPSCWKEVSVSTPSNLILNYFNLSTSCLHLWWIK